MISHTEPFIRLRVYLNPPFNYVFPIHTLSWQGHTRSKKSKFCDLRRYFQSAYVQYASFKCLAGRKIYLFSTLRPQSWDFVALQGRRLRRTGRTPIEDNAAKRRNIVIEACVPLSREGTVTQNDFVVIRNIQQCPRRFGMGENQCGEQDICVNQYPHITFPFRSVLRPQVPEYHPRW